MGSRSEIDLILNRRSTREFSARPIDTASVQLVVEAGLRAPSSKNSQPWYIAVVTGAAKEQLCRWVEENRDELPTTPGDLRIDEPQARPGDSTATTLRYIREAPVLLLVFNRGPFSGGRQGIGAAFRSGELPSFENEYIGLGASMENMLLAADALDLGAIAVMDIMPAAPRIADEWGIKYDLVVGVLLGRPERRVASRRRLDFDRFVTYRDEAAR